MRPDIALPESDRLQGVFRCRATEASDQAGAPRPNPVQAIGPAHETIDLSERRSCISQVEEYVRAPTGDRRSLTLVSLRKDDAVEMDQRVFILADMYVIVAQGIVGFGEVRVQPQSFAIVLNRSFLLTEPLKTRPEILVALAR